MILKILVIERHLHLNNKQLLLIVRKVAEMRSVTPRELRPINAR